MSVNAYTARDLPTVDTNQPRNPSSSLFRPSYMSSLSFDEEAKAYQQSTQVRTRLDTLEDDFNRDGFYKITAINSHNKDKGEATVVLEMTEDRSKWAMFKDWVCHKFGHFTDRDKDKFDSAKVVVNAIRDELIALYPDASARRINEGTQAVVNKVTGGAVSVMHTMYDSKENLNETPKDKYIQSTYTSKYPHAFSAHEVVLANNMLHNAKVIGLPHLGVAPSTNP